MNQIIYTNKNKKNRFLSFEKYKIMFIFFSSLALVFLFLLFYKLYRNAQYERISQKLNSSYSISTLYSNSTNNVFETQITNPFVIGIIKIDKINLNYSILSVSNNDLLDISVCRFAGPMPNEIGNLCIAGHNYVDYKFFSRVNELDINDIIQIYDLSGNFLNYKIYDKYETVATDLSCTFQDTNGNKIVTLITCNNVNGKRLIIHAKEIPT